LAAKCVAKPTRIQGTRLDVVKKIGVEVQIRGGAKRLKRFNASRRVNFD
jgi:hypothetical protein